MRGVPESIPLFRNGHQDLSVAAHLQRPITVPVQSVCSSMSVSLNRDYGNTAYESIGTLDMCKSRTCTMCKWLPDEDDDENKVMIPLACALVCLSFGSRPVCCLPPWAGVWGMTEQRQPMYQGSAQECRLIMCLKLQWWDKHTRHDALYLLVLVRNIHSHSIMTACFSEIAPWVVAWNKLTYLTSLTAQ